MVLLNSLIRRVSNGGEERAGEWGSEGLVRGKAVVLSASCRGSGAVGVAVTRLLQQGILGCGGLVSGRPKIRRALHPQMDRALMSPTQVTYSQPPGTVIGVHTKNSEDTSMQNQCTLLTAHNVLQTV